MAKRSKKSMFREFKKKKPDEIQRGYLKYIRMVYRDMAKNYDVNESQINTMIFVEDYEFFTLDHLSEAYMRNKALIGRRIVYPLVNMGYMYKYYDKLSPATYQEAMFAESKFKYRVRYALSQKGRLFVQRFYRKLEGEEQINVPI